MGGTEDAGKEMSVILCRESDLLSEEGTLERWNMPCRATILLAVSATAIRDMEPVKTHFQNIGLKAIAAAETKTCSVWTDGPSLGLLLTVQSWLRKFYCTNLLTFEERSLEVLNVIHYRAMEIKEQRSN